MRLTAEQFAEIAQKRAAKPVAARKAAAISRDTPKSSQGPVKRKYGNKKVEIDGVVFDSQKEARRYAELKLMEKARQITSLSLQPKWELIVNGQKICRYVADFLYVDCATGKRIVEDVKGMKPPVYRIKAKLMLACHGIEIVEI